MSSYIRPKPKLSPRMQERVRTHRRLVDDARRSPRFGVRKIRINVIPAELLAVSKKQNVKLIINVNEINEVKRSR